MFKKIANNKRILIILSTIFFVLILFIQGYERPGKCMGISFITEEEVQQKAVNRVELGNIVLLKDHLVPYENESNKLYIPCVIDDDSSSENMNGILKSRLPEYELFFLENSFFEILSEAVKYNCTFSLYAIDADGNYDLYEVIFTTLPIVEMQGECVEIDEEQRDVFYGEINVWEPDADTIDSLKYNNSQVKWHVRGNSTRDLQKKSYKLTLKEKNGDNNHLSLLGFQEDDDYLLNAMYSDDVKIREKLTMSLWNEIAEKENSSLKMSHGEYCELLINGQYMGLRLMQNRIDKKFLKLDTNDMLLKGKSNAKTKTPEEVYEVIYSYDEEAAYRSMDNFFYEKDFSNLDIKNWVDLTLFLELGNMGDNQKYKNIYYLIDGDSGMLSLIPWDTDLSFGLWWKDGFRYLPENVEKITHRMEHEKVLEQYPYLEKVLAERWRELRVTTFSNENIINKMNIYYESLYKSGALKRDHDVLGWYLWRGQDTLDNMIIYLEKRLEVLDNYYGVDI